MLVFGLTLAYSTFSRDRERDLSRVGVLGKLSPDEADEGRLEHSRTMRCVVVFDLVDALLIGFVNFSSIVSSGFDDRREMERRRRSF